mmetsp:Transcript_103883/g.323784  ORF Transcript_103883/g.323784 Transcript_103883/m.323784 type:complete len:245 (+) Transcript_103883:274-1008(+)
MEIPHGARAQDVRPGLPVGREAVWQVEPVLQVIADRLLWLRGHDRVVDPIGAEALGAYFRRLRHGGVVGHGVVEAEALYEAVAAVRLHSRRAEEAELRHIVLDLARARDVPRCTTRHQGRKLGAETPSPQVGFAPRGPADLVPRLHLLESHGLAVKRGLAEGGEEPAIHVRRHVQDPGGGIGRGVGQGGGAGGQVRTAATRGTPCPRALLQEANVVVSSARVHVGKGTRVCGGRTGAGQGQEHE